MEASVSALQEDSIVLPALCPRVGVGALQTGLRVIVDLALTIEIITKTGIRAASTKLASFLAMGDESEEIQRIYSEFADLRNKVIHGSVAEKIEKYGQIRMRVYVTLNGRIALGGEAVLIPPGSEL